MLRVFRFSLRTLVHSPGCSAGEIHRRVMHDPPFLCACLTPRSAPPLRAQVQQRVDGRQRDQTGEAEILVVHGALSKPSRLPGQRRYWWREGSLTGHDASPIHCQPEQVDKHETLHQSWGALFFGRTKPLPSKSRPRCSQSCKSTASNSVVVQVLNDSTCHLLLASHRG